VGKSSPADTFSGGTGLVERTHSRLRSDYGVLIGKPGSGDGAGVDACGTPERVARGQIPAAAMIRVGSHVVSYPREIEKYAAKLAAIEEAKHELERTLTPKKATVRR